MAAPAPTDPELAQIEQIAKVRGMEPWETQAVVDALASARRGMGDLQVQTERLRWQLSQNGVDPTLADIAVRLLHGDFRGEAKAAASGQLTDAAQDISGPAPGKRAQLAGRSADFMQDQRASTFQYQQPDLNRARPTRPTPTNTPPMLDRNRAPFLVRKPDGSFEFDPTYGEQAPADGFTGPAAPPITARRPPFFAPSGQVDQRDALYRELNQAIQGRIAPAPGNLAASMGDAYVLEQMIPALRERFADRPDILRRLAEIQGHATHTFPEDLPGGAGPAPGVMELDEFGNPIPMGGEGERWRRLPTRGIGPQRPPQEWTATSDPAWGPGGEPKSLPFQDNPQPYREPPRSGPIKTMRASRVDARAAQVASQPWENAIGLPDATRSTQGGALARGLEAPIAPDTVAGELAGPPPRTPAPMRPVPIRPQETTGINGPMDPAQQVHPSRLPPGEGRTAKARIQLPPGGKVLSSSSEFPAAGHPGAWDAEWGAQSLEPSYQGSAPKPGSAPSRAAPKGGAGKGGNAAAVGWMVGDVLLDRYGSSASTLSNEQLRELLLIARGKYPAGDMQAQPAR